MKNCHHIFQLFYTNYTIDLENTLKIKQLWETCYLQPCWQQSSCLPIRINDIFCLLDVDVGLIICDANSTLEVHAGENVTIHCTALPNVQYRWTKVRENWLLLTSNTPSIWTVFMCYIILFCPRARNCCQRMHPWTCRGWLMLTEGLTHWLSTQGTKVCTKHLASQCYQQPQAYIQVSFISSLLLPLFVSHSLSVFPQGSIYNLAEGLRDWIT